MLLAETGRPAEAVDAFRGAAGLYEELSAGAPTWPPTRAGLAATSSSLGLPLRQLGRHAESEAAFRRAVGLLESLAAASRDPKAHRYDLAVSLDSLAYSSFLAGHPKEAEAGFRRAVELLEALVAASSRPYGVLQNTLASSCNNLANVLRLSGRPEESESVLRRALELRTSLVEQLPDVPKFRSGLGGTLNDLALLQFVRGDLDEARRLLEQAIPHQKVALASNPRDPTYRQFLSNHYLNLAKVLGKRREPDELARVIDDWDRSTTLGGPDVDWAARSSTMRDARRGVPREHSRGASRPDRRRMPNGPRGCAARRSRRPRNSGGREKIGERPRAFATPGVLHPSGRRRPARWPGGCPPVCELSRRPEGPSRRGPGPVVGDGAPSTREDAMTDSKPTPAADRAGPPGPEPLEGRALWRAAGSLDPTFGTGGIVTTSLTSKGSDRPRRCSSSPTASSSPSATGMARYNTNGTLDTSFGSGGKVTSASGNAAALYPAGTANAGKIVTAAGVHGGKTAAATSP